MSELQFKSIITNLVINQSMLVAILKVLGVNEKEMNKFQQYAFKKCILLFCFKHKNADIQNIQSYICNKIHKLLIKSGGSRENLVIIYKINKNALTQNKYSITILTTSQNKRLRTAWGWKGVCKDEKEICIGLCVFDGAGSGRLRRDGFQFGIHSRVHGIFDFTGRRGVSGGRIRHAHAGRHQGKRCVHADDGHGLPAL